MATQISTPCRGANGKALGSGHDANWTEAPNGEKVPAGAHRLGRKVKKKAEEESLLGYLCTQICEHQIGIAVNLLLLLFLTHIFFPRARRRTSKFFHLNYYNAETEKYGCGTDDLPFVALWIVIFTGMRVAVMDFVLGPLARLGGIKTKKGQVRFKEQAWLICYCTCSWSLGMYISYHSEFWLNLHGMWQGWPFREISGLSKFYYLVQWAFWVQQIVVVNIEEKRKDYAQMFTHHIFTIALLFLSYGYYHTRVGIVILCIMDLVDIVLPTAKLLKYMGYSTICDVMFGVFVLTWLVTRHFFYPLVCYSIYRHAPVDMEPGCYFPPSSDSPHGSFVPASNASLYNELGGNAIWPNLLKAYTDRTGPICWNPDIRYSFLVLLLALQGMILLWFAMILKVVWKVLRGQSADDVRSDDEEGDEQDEVVKEEFERVSAPINAAKAGTEWVPVEQEVGVEALSFASRKGSAAAGGTAVGVRRSSRRSGRASGISIPGHGDHKELLGRIGCDKPT